MLKLLKPGKDDGLAFTPAVYLYPFLVGGPGGGEQAPDEPPPGAARSYARTASVAEALDGKTTETYLRHKFSVNMADTRYRGNPFAVVVYVWDGFPVGQIEGAVLGSLLIGAFPEPW